MQKEKQTLADYVAMMREKKPIIEAEKQAKQAEKAAAKAAKPTEEALFAITQSLLEHVNIGIEDLSGLDATKYAKMVNLLQGIKVKKGRSGGNEAHGERAIELRSAGGGVGQPSGAAIGGGGGQTSVSATGGGGDQTSVAAARGGAEAAARSPPKQVAPQQGGPDDPGPKRAIF